MHHHLITGQTIILLLVLAFALVLLASSRKGAE